MILEMVLFKQIFIFICYFEKKNNTKKEVIVRSHAQCEIGINKKIKVKIKNIEK